MRGKHFDSCQQFAVFRITPAHAGKTRPRRPVDSHNGDHPRACGENPYFLDKEKAFPGSPPRMRGKREGTIDRLVGSGITPAHAGKTICNRDPRVGSRDHPRACGENCKRLGLHSKVAGSPPRMRGKLIESDFCFAASGITPAHAGKTLRKWRISVVDPSPQPQSSLTSRRADASSGSQRAPCAAPV